MNQQADLSRSSQPPSEPKSRPDYELLVRSLDGYLFSIVAIGCIRAWLSFQTGILSGVPTNLFATDELALLRSFVFIIMFLAFSYIRLGKAFEKYREQISLGIGCLASATYILGLLFAESSFVLSICATIILACVFSWMIRLWGEDNCTASYDVVVVRLGLSFLVQYIIYAALLVLPYEAQCVCAVLLPLGICFILRKKPAPSRESGEGTSTVKPATLSGSKKSLIMLMVGLCCAAHGILFIFSPAVSGVWIFGSLIIAVISLSVVMLMKDTSLFKGLVCITISLQCLSVLLILAFPSNFDWVSLSKSLSYAIGMILALSIGCRLGASHENSQGRSVSMWMAVYFISFYTATNIAAFLNPDPTAALIVVLLFLIVAAVIMISNDWTEVFSHAQERSSFKKPNEEELEEIRSRLAYSGGLTQRESDVLLSLLQGLSAKEIAAENCVSKNTVRTQVQSVYRKLDIHNRNDLIELVASEQR